jgi:CreA protein
MDVSCDSLPLFYPSTSVIIATVTDKPDENILFHKSSLPLLLLVALSLSSHLLMAERLAEVSTKFRMLGPNDKVVIEAFDDPAVSGVTCYLSRAKTGGMSGAVGLAEDTSDASIACRQTGPVNLSPDIRDRSRDGEEVFKQRTSILFKTMQVVRFYDARRNTLIYLTYSDKLVDGSPKNSITAVPLYQPTLTPSAQE